LRCPDLHRRFRRAVLAVVLLAVGVAPASAHRLKVFASQIGGSIEGEAYFVGSGPAAGVTVTLRDGADTVLETGATGPDGRFALPSAGGGDIVVVVDAQDGHVARFTVAGAEPAPAPPAAPPAAPAETTGQPVVPLADVELAVARRIAPLAAQIDALESALRLRDILGGLGYIAGLFGLLAFVKSRRKGNAP
jgi:nickel transport protein